MVTIDFKKDTILVTVVGFHQILGLKRKIEFKKEHVKSIRKADISLRPPWFRAPGTYVPGLIAVGTYYGKGKREFWDTTFKGKAIEIELKNEKFTKLIVDVVDPDKITTVASRE